MSTVDLVALVCCDLAGLVRGRSLPAGELEDTLGAGVGWVPADMALTALGPLAEPNPFGSTGDLRLLPDMSTRARLEPEGPEDSAFELVLCDLVEVDGAPWACCPRRFLRDSLEELEEVLGVRVAASFEHEFQLRLEPPVPPPFSLRAQRRADPLPGRLMGALLAAGVEPQQLLPEFAPHQFEIPLAPAEGLAAADRSVIFKEVVHEVVRRAGVRATFAPLLDPQAAGNGLHIHFSLTDGAGRHVLYDARRPASLSELGGKFAAGILRHAPALSALTAASPPSAARLSPHHWSAGAVCLGERNREALVRIPPLVSLAGADPAPQMRLEYRGADATANPYIALGAILRAGTHGVREDLAPAPILAVDPATLEGAEAERFGVGALPRSLADALQELDEDPVARGWMNPLLYDAYVSLKRGELEAVTALELEEICRLYAEAY